MFRSMNAELKKGVETSLRGVRQQLQNVSDDTHKIVEHTSAGVMTRIGAVASFAGNLAAQGVASLARMGVGAVTAGIKTAAGMEQAQIAFGTLLHSTTQAKSFLSDLEEFAAKTPFELPGLIDASRQLLGVGMKAKDVIPALTAYGDAAGALGLSQDNFNHIMLATSQAMSAGTLHAGDLLQMTEAGLPVWKLLSEALGKPVSEIKKLSEQGKLMSADVLPKLQAQMEKDYGGAMSKQSQTLSGLWSTLMDTLHQGEAKVLMPLEPLLAKAIPKAADFLGVAFKKVGAFFTDLITGVTKGKGRFADLRGVFNDVKDSIVNIGHFIGPFIVDIGHMVKSWGGVGGILKTVSGHLKTVTEWLAKNGDTIRPIVVILGTMIAAWKTYQFGVRTVIAVQTALNVVMSANPIGLVVIAIAGLVAGLIYAYKHSEAFRNVVDKLWKSLKESAAKIRDFFGAIGKNVMASFTEMSNFAGKVESTVKGFFSGMSRNVMASFNDMTKSGDKVKSFFLGIPGALKSLNTSMSKLGHDIVDKFRSGASDNWHTVSTWFGGTLKRIDSAIGNAKQWATNFGTAFVQNVQKGNAGAWHLISDWFHGMLARIGTAIGNARQWAVNFGTTFIQNELRGITIIWHVVTDWFRGMLNRIGGAIGNAKQWMINFGIAFIQAELRGITTIWHIMPDWFRGMLTRIGNAIGDAAGWAKRLGTSLINNELAGVKAVWHIVPDWFRGMIGRIASAIGNWTKYFHDIGWGMITGLLRGLAGTWHIVTDWFGKVPGWIKSALGIKSPPAWAIDAGGWIMRGLVKGLIGGSFSFTSFLKHLTTLARERIATFVSGAHGSVGMYGLHADILRVLAAVRAKFGFVRLISGLRPGATTLSGNQSRHALGEAIDLPAIYSMTKWISQTFGRFLRELISPWNSLNILRGHHHTYTGDVFAQHAGTGRFKGNAHTHVAYERGAWRIPNDQLAYLHAREMVVPAGPAEAIRAGVGQTTMTHLSDETIEKLGMAFARAIGAAGHRSLVRSRQYGLGGVS